MHPRGGHRTARDTFYASISLRANGRELEIDSRPSDALALAVRSGAPIFAADDVISESAIEFEHEVEDTEEVVEKFKDFLDHVGRGLRLRRVAARPRVSRAAASTRAIAGQPSREDPRDQVVEADAGRVGRLRQQAGLGQPGDRVDLDRDSWPVS